MRLSILPVLIAGAGIGTFHLGEVYDLTDIEALFAVSQVSAEPIRVVESPSNANANIRFGHALANANVNGNDDSDNVVRLVRPTVVMTTTTEVKGKGFGHHFCGASLKAKALRMSNAFRHALGLPPIDMGDHVTFKGEVPSNVAPMTGEVRILPMPFVGAPIAAPANPSEHSDVGSVRILPVGEPHRHHHHHHHHHHDKHKQAGTFGRRIHRAIMALSPWEGRAVAFVLGKCFAFITKTPLICLERLWHWSLAPHVLGYVCPRISHHQR